MRNALIIAVARALRWVEFPITKNGVARRGGICADIGKRRTKIIDILDVDDPVAVEPRVCGAFVVAVAFLGYHEIESDPPSLTVGKLGCVLLPCRETLFMCGTHQQFCESDRVLVFERAP